MALLAGWENSHPSRKIQKKSSALYPVVCPLCGEVGGDLVGNRVYSQHAQESFPKEIGWQGRGLTREDKK